MTELYGDFHEDEDLEENEDDIGALGSILSWEDEEDEDPAVNRTAAAMSSALSERENAAGTSAPPDMVQFSMKDGIPQFNFLSNALGQANNTAASNQQQTVDSSGNLTLQLPMPTPISKLENPFPPQQQQQQTQQQAQLQTLQQPAPNTSEKLNNPLAMNNNNNPQALNNPNNNAAGNGVQQLVNQQQSQQGLAATFAQLLAQQAGNLFQQQQQNQPAPQQQQQPTNPPMNTTSQQANVDTVQQQAQQAVQQAAQQFQQQQLQAAQQAAQQQQTQQQQQQIQQTQQQQIQQTQPQQQQIQQTQPQQQTQQPVMQQQQAPAPSNQPQLPQQLQLPFGTDPSAFLQQLQFAQFQQFQMQAQQQQQQQQASQQQQQQHTFPSAASVNAATLASFAPAPALNPRPPGPPPTKRTKRSKAASSAQPPAPPVTTTLPPPKPVTKDTKKPAPAPSASKTGIVSASDTDCDGPTKKAARGTSSTTTATAEAAAPPPAAKKAPPKREAASASDSNFSADDKAQANRDRNREHARNTRLRKKAYLEKLKTTVEELCRERDTLVSERAGAASLLVEMHNTRTEVLMSFFALRSSNEKRRKLWSSILDESSFAAVMPVTPYRSFPASEVQVSKCQRTVMGIDAVMADTASLHVLFQSLVDRKKYPNGKIEFRYTLVTEESVVAGNQMMARWVMSTVNATKCGALTEVAKQGMLCCKFNSAHRIIGLELMFDVMAFMLQLKQAAGSDSFSVIPNTVQTCQRTFDKPMVMTLADPPFTIVQVNKLWEEMTGFSAEEVVGKTSCSILQGPKTDKKALAQLMEEVRFKRPGSAYVANVKKTGEEFQHFLLVFPLSTDSRVTHYVALSNHVGLCPKDVPSQAPVLQQQPGTIPANNQAPQTTIPNKNGVAAPQMQPYFVAPGAPMVFHPQPQVVGSANNFRVGGAVGQLMAPPPPNAPAEQSMNPSS